MSGHIRIEAEVPYDDVDHSIQIDWRDAEIFNGAGNNTATNAGSDDYVPSDAPDRMPDDHWVLPSNCTLVEILGANKSRLSMIRERTGTYCEYNFDKHQIDIWGEKSAVDNAKNCLALIAEPLLKRREIRRKTNKWGKPERELTEKEKQRQERRMAKAMEERSYQALPSTAQPYSNIFALPDKNLPLLEIQGEKESYLNSLRAECKCHIWYESSMNVFKVTGQNEDNVDQATERLRNWYLKRCRKPVAATLKLLDQPEKNLIVKFRKLPMGFVTYKYHDGENEKFMLEKHRLLEPIRTGVPMKLSSANLNLIDLSAEELPQAQQPEEPLSERAQSLNKRNMEQIKEALAQGLESIRLFDWEIRMKIRFGQICLVDYPKKESNMFTTEELSDKYFPQPKFRSVLAPCIAKNRDQIKPLFEHLSHHGVEYSDSPRTTFTIDALQYPTLAPIPTGRRDGPPPPRGNTWETVMMAKFTGDRHVGLWNCLTDCVDLVTINCAALQHEYSWESKLQYARRLPAEIDTPHGQFAHKLTIGPEGRLVLVNVPDYQPRCVTQKTKWVYGWGDYVVEVGRDEIWNLSLITHTDKKLPLDLGGTPPHRVIYKVSMYRESWQDRFADNLCLGIGESPRWTPEDFLGTPDENAYTFMEGARKFADVLHKELPVYWSQEGSLV
ncbi:hypothetical protein DFQ28_001571 [Apophysomyces sp. BC1034]|nr:hypothetical protein DFQ30_001484 [Apophysomyces sp. BC1015]KAG0182516.1 hypothetical protein DFQ29_003742 [Apophysomyces sp. BC1021]KAG0194079.1 hypothetical protein DFQ28_001571 [Apophysomyces sp. BC1034]